MEDLMKDQRFAHIGKDPRFRTIPKSERKVKIDKRFQSMFKDKKFSIKYTVDKRGRPVNQTSAENLKKYYDISSSDEDYSKEEFSDQDKQSVNKQIRHNITSSKEKNITTKNFKYKQSRDELTASTENLSSNGSLLLLKNLEHSASDTESEKDLDEEATNKGLLKENENQLKSVRTNDKKLDGDVKKKLRDLTVDYARGEGVLLSDSSSDEESSESDNNEDNEIEHNWGELDKEAETTHDITHRLAACNMDWDRIRAIDLNVLFNSFLPTGGLINSVIIYPSEFGLQRMKEEELKGPTELVENKNNKDDNEIIDEDDVNGSCYHMEKLRQYQLNRLKYYYAVIDFDSANTANKIYTECDGLEYESSSTKLDLRFIPDDMTFEQEPKEVCYKLPDLTKYQPRLFTTTALQQIKVDLTWDETNLERQEITQKLSSGKLDEIDKNDIQAYLASGTSEDESEDEVKRKLQEIDDTKQDENPIDKYKSLLKSIEQAEEEKKDKEVELEFTWGIGDKEKTEQMVKEKMKKIQTLTPFEQYLEKRKAKRKAKRDEKKLKQNNNKSDSEDSIPSDIDMNSSYFAEELQSIKEKTKKRKNTFKNSDKESDDENEKKRQAELELLLMEEDEDHNKHHFSMKRIEEAESLTKSKKKRLSKKKKDLKEEANKDNFEVNVEDPRFSALFTSHHYNIDPADPHYRKTKGTEALIHEKLNRRNKNDTNFNHLQKSTDNGKNDCNYKANTELNSLIKAIKRNTQNFSKRLK